MTQLAEASRENITMVMTDGFNLGGIPFVGSRVDSSVKTPTDPEGANQPNPKPVNSLEPELRNLAQHWEAIGGPLPTHLVGQVLEATGLPVPNPWQGGSVKTQLSIRGPAQKQPKDGTYQSAVGRKIEIFEKMGVPVPFISRFLPASLGAENVRVVAMMQSADTATEALMLRPFNPHGGAKEDRRVVDELLPGWYLGRLNRTSYAGSSGTSGWLRTLGLDLGGTVVSKVNYEADHQAFGFGVPKEEGGSTLTNHRGAATVGAELGVSVPLPIPAFQAVRQIASPIAKLLPFNAGLYRDIKVGERKIYSYTVNRDHEDAVQAGLVAMRPSGKRLARNPATPYRHLADLETIAARDQHLPAEARAVQRDFLITETYREGEAIGSAGFTPLSADLTNVHLENHVHAVRPDGTEARFGLVGQVQRCWKHLLWQDFENSGISQNFAGVFVREDEEGKATGFGHLICSAANLPPKGVLRSEESNAATLEDFRETLGPWAERAGLGDLKARPQFWNNLQVAIAPEGLDAFLDAEQTTPHVLATALKNMAHPDSPYPLSSFSLPPPNPVSFRKPEEMWVRLRAFDAMKAQGAEAVMKDAYDCIYTAWGRRAAHDLFGEVLPAVLKLQQKAQNPDPRMRDQVYKATSRLLGSLLGRTSLVNNHGKKMTTRFLLEVLDSLGMADAVSIRAITVHTQGRGKDAEKIDDRNLVSEKWYGDAPQRGSDLELSLRVVDRHLYTVAFLP